MKTIQTNAIISGIRRLSDKSLSLNVHTPELTPTEAAYFMEFQNLNSYFIIRPLDEAPDEAYEIKTEVNEKTPSQRVRAVLFLLWKQNGEPGTFADFYNQKMEQIITSLKTKLEGGD